MLEGFAFRARFDPIVTSPPFPIPFLSAATLAAADTPVASQQWLSFRVGNEGMGDPV